MKTNDFRKFMEEVDPLIAKPCKMSPTKFNTLDEDDDTTSPISTTSYHVDDSKTRLLLYNRL